MATDTAFAIALIAVLGPRVPVELRVFLTAAAVVDDIGAILVIAFFYSADLQYEYLAAAGALTVSLALLNRARVYRLSPYILLGVALWACIHAAGLHATLAGVILALFIPTRPPPDLKALTAQANTILSADMRCDATVTRCATVRHYLPCTHSRQFITVWSPRPPACCVAPERVPVTWYYPSSHWLMPESLCRST